jgi:hypothetical protein
VSIPGKADGVACRECGAMHFSPTSHCWLCSAPLGPQVVVEAEIVSSPLATRPTYMTYTEPMFAVGTIGALILLVLIGIGCAVDNQIDTLVGFLIFTVPPLIGSLIYLLRRRTSGGSVTWMERFITLLASAAVTFGLFMLLIFALIAILFVACFGMIIKESL